MLLTSSNLSAPAQEALRLSLAGEQAAEARRKAVANLDHDNLKLGPTTWSFDAALALEASDNIRLETQHPQSDLILRPEAGARMATRAARRWLMVDG